MARLVGVDESAATALSECRIVKSTVCAQYRKLPTTYWTYLLFYASRTGESYLTVISCATLPHFLGSGEYGQLYCLFGRG